MNFLVKRNKIIYIATFKGSFGHREFKSLHRHHSPKRPEIFRAFFI